MRQFVTIAANAFMELIRQPVFLLLMTLSSLFEVFLSCVNYFGFGDEPKLVKNTFVFSDCRASEIALAPRLMAA